MYQGCKTVVRSAAGESNSFGVEVGLHQGSALSPYLFLLLMDVLTQDVRKDVPGSMIFADDIVLCGDDETDMTEYLETWRKALEEREMRISRPKTQFMDFNFGQDNGQEREPVKILGEELQRLHHFKYLGSSAEETGGMSTEITQRVSAAWRNWKRSSEVLCDRRMPVKLKGKVYKTVVRPAVLYGAETWATTRGQEARLEVNEMRMLRWMCGVTRRGKIQNEHIRGTTRVVQASKKITEKLLKWYGHVRRMKEEHIVRRMLDVDIPRKRRRGRPNLRWKDACKRDMTQAGLKEHNATNRAEWRKKLISYTGDPRWRDKPGMTKKKIATMRDGKLVKMPHSCHHVETIRHPNSSYVTTKLYGTSTCGCNNNTIFSKRAILTFLTVDVCRAPYLSSTTV